MLECQDLLVNTGDLELDALRAGQAPGTGNSGQAAPL